MLETVTLETFAPHVGEPFEIQPADGAALAATLLAVEPVPGGRDAARLGVRRVPFSVVWRAPRGADVPQQICAVRHPALGTLELFLVPIGPDEVGMRYEAVFT